MKIYQNTMTVVPQSKDAVTKKKTITSAKMIHIAPTPFTPYMTKTLDADLQFKQTFCWQLYGQCMRADSENPLGFSINNERELCMSVYLQITENETHC